MWRNDKACARKKNSDLKKYLGQTGNKTTRMPPELNEREKLMISIIGKETSEGIGVGEAGFGQATFNTNIDDCQFEYIGLEVKNILLINYKQFLVQYELNAKNVLQDHNELIYTVAEVEDLSETIECRRGILIYPS